MAAFVQPQRLPTTAEPVASRRGWRGDLRRLARSSRVTQRISAAALIAPSDTQPDEPKTKSTRLLGEQRADAWAFGCVLASLALHQKRAKELSSKAGLHRSQGQGRATRSDDMYGWDEYTSVSKDRPGRCSRLKLAAEAAAEDKPRGPRTARVELRFKALGQLASQLKSSKRRPCSDHSESSSNAPEADAPLPSAPPSPPTSSAAADAGAAPALARVGAHETSAEEWSLGPPHAKVSEAVRAQLKAAVDRRRQQGRATIAPALQQASSGQPQGAEDGLAPAAAPSRTLSARAALQPGLATTAHRLKLEQSRLLTPDARPANANEAAMVMPTSYVLMLRLCQGKVSPLDGVTPSCCPGPLLQLATQCCTHNPEARPSLAAMLEQLQGEILLSIDAAAYGAGAGAQRPLPALEGWRDAAERTLLGKEPANDEGGGALGPAGAHAAGADHSNACSAPENPATCGSTSTHDSTWTSRI